MPIDRHGIASRIDHALLLPQMTEAEVEGGCQLAHDYQVATVCVRPADIARARCILNSSTVGVGTVIGFPHGSTLRDAKCSEAALALETGAQELDMVVNIGQVRSGRWAEVSQEIKAIHRLAQGSRAVLKVIFENCYLTDAEKIQLCEICGEVGVDYVKTSTGFGTSGATEPDLILMRKHTPVSVKLKAAGGMKDLATAIRFVELGCDRLGTSQTKKILDEFQELDDASVSRETPPTATGPGQDY